jgi:hypothetical protein
MVVIKTVEKMVETEIVFEVQCEECGNAIAAYFAGQHLEILRVDPCPHCLRVQRENG